MHTALKWNVVNKHGRLSVVRYLVALDANVHTDNDAAIYSRYAPRVRYLQRLAFGVYMDKPELADVMTPAYAHYVQLMWVYRNVLGKAVAMDIQHLVVEMLSGSSVMGFFRQKGLRRE